MKTTPSNLRQAGVTLMEMLIAMAISLVVALAMVGMMSNTLGSGTVTIETTRLTSELRTALQIMSRDVRRANYHGTYVECFANIDCLNDLGISGYIKTITIDPGGDCFFFWVDRHGGPLDPDPVIPDGDLSNDEVGAFRRAIRGGVGTIEMTAALTTGPGWNGCNDPDVWTPLTDPNIVDVTEFAVDNALSYTDNIAGGATQTVDKIRMSITGQLAGITAATTPECFDAAGDNLCARTVEDIIRVRNDIYAPAAPPP